MNDEPGLLPTPSPEERALTALVDERFAELAARAPATPGWPDPWPDAAVPDDGAYERFTRPERFEIVVRRVEAWIEALAASGLAAYVVDADPLAAWIQREEPRWLPSTPPPHTRVVRPRVPGATALVLAVHRWAAPTGSAVQVVVGAGEPAVPVEEPDCLCDACDTGSADLLAAYDRQVLDVVRGSFCWVGPPDVEIRVGQTTQSSGVQGRALRWPRRWTRRDTERAVAEARAGRSAYPHLVADVPWWSRA